ncbi:MAG: zinc ribbon domain-containing protein [Lachnospiraceae bacterium]|nr:zinc ribbon domain-containing protein [Lachnospiraceae bacterium]
MKCPKCQTEINSNAKFCTKCGCNLAAEMAKATANMSAPAASGACVKCGASLKPGAKFCVKCGTPVTPAKAQEPENKTVFLYGNDNDSDMQRTMAINTANTQAGVAQGNRTQSVIPVQDDIVPPSGTGKKEKNKKEKQPKQSKSTGKAQSNEKAGSGLIIAIVVLLILVIASAAVCFLVWNGTISLPAIGGGIKSDQEETTTEEETEASTETETEKTNADTEELFAEADALLAEGKNQIAVDAEIMDGMESLRNAMNQFAEKAQEAGDASLVSDKIADAYASYVSAVIRHKDMMDGQSISGSIYSQIMSELNDAEALAKELSEKGYTVDTSSLTSAKDSFDTSYTSRVITAFDDFTNRTAWSRTEAWNLMSGFDSMFDNSDLDNPLKLRYAYALSWWVQKQIETELASGTITEKGAAIKIANMIEDMDYNPMMINYYISYMNKAGEDCANVSDAYDEIVEHIAQTQGIRIGEDIALERFWYFNDFGTYSVDSSNGVTPENRQWIRDRMSSVQFVQ